MRWLMSVNRLAVRAVASWSCYVKTKTCPMINCQEDETQQHLLMDCYRAKEVWDKLKVYGVNFVLSYKSVMYCIVDETIRETKRTFTNNHMYCMHQALENKMLYGYSTNNHK